MPPSTRSKRMVDTPAQRQKTPKRRRGTPASPPPATPSNQECINAPPQTNNQQSSVPPPLKKTSPRKDGQLESSQWEQPDWWDAGDHDKARRVRACLDIGNDTSNHAVPEGRQHEAAAVEEFINTCLHNMQGGSMYISGRPGTGKSLTVHTVLDRLASAGTTSSLCDLPPALVSINCYAIGDVRDVFDHMASGIEAACAPRAHLNEVLRHAVGEGDPGCREGCSGASRLSKLVTAPVDRARDRRKSITGRQSRGMYVVLLDEMDHLLQHPSAALIPQLLSLAGVPESRLVLLGVANSMDLVERMLEGVPHLQHMSFKAYTPIQAVLQKRLALLPGPVFATPALMLCARKVAAASGDMRRALEVCRKAVDHVTAGPVGMREVAAALARVNGGAGSTSTRVAAIRDLPLQQQLLLCAARKVMARVDAPTDGVLAPINLNGQACRLSTGKRLSLGGQTPGKRLSLGGGREATQADVLDAYVRLCESIGVAHVTKEEFFSMCSNMVDNSYLVTPAGRCGEQPRLQRVGCAVTDAELLEAVKDNRLLRNVLEGGQL